MLKYCSLQIEFRVMFLSVFLFYKHVLFPKLEIMGKILLFFFALLDQALDPFILPSFSMTCARVLKLYIPDYTSTIFCPGMMKGFAYYGNIIKNLSGA